MVQLVYPDPFGSFLKGLRQAEEDNRKDMQLLDRLYRTYLMEQRQKAQAAASKAAASYDAGSLADEVYRDTFGDNTLAGDQGTMAEETAENTGTTVQEDTGYVEQNTPKVPAVTETEKLPLLPSTPPGELPQPVPPPPLDAPPVGTQKIQDRIRVSGYEKIQDRIPVDTAPVAPPVPQPPTVSTAQQGVGSFVGKFPFEKQFAAKIQLGGTTLAERAAPPAPPLPPPPYPDAVPYAGGRTAPITTSDRAVGGSPADMYAGRPELNRQTGQVRNKTTGRISLQDVQRRVGEVYKELFSLQIAGLTNTQRYQQLLAEYDRLNQVLAGQ